MSIREIELRKLVCTHAREYVYKSERGCVEGGIRRGLCLGNNGGGCGEGVSGGGLVRTFLNPTEFPNKQLY